MNLKQSIQQSGNRRDAIILGAIVFLVSFGFIIFNQLAVYNWKEAPVVKSQAISPCPKTGTLYMYTYEVESKLYTLEACTHSVFTSVTYNPSNPSIALINTYSAYQIISVVGAILGAVLLLGGIFLRDDPSQSRKLEEFFWPRS